VGPQRRQRAAGLVGRSRVHPVLGPRRFTAGFGCPTSLNFGRDYAGARDQYVHAGSPDGAGAYEPADRMVLARVPRGRIRERAAYDFFAELDGAGQPRWTAEIARRESAFTHPGRCGRSSLGHDAGLGRYLWVQARPGVEPRVRGGPGIYDAPRPWGPRTTVDFAEDWDVGPGESAGLPTRWMSADGRVLYLVFPGRDSSSVRRATLIVPEGRASRAAASDRPRSGR
jgi:hypothetical protein